MTAVIYARYSSDNQREESIEGQIRECKAFAEKQGLTMLNSYIDRAFSAKTQRYYLPYRNKILTKIFEIKRMQAQLSWDLITTDVPGDSYSSIMFVPKQLELQDNNSLDYGAGKGRLISNLVDFDQQDCVVLDKREYIAFDKSVIDKVACLETLDRVLGTASKRYYNDFSSLFADYDENTFDVVVMCNVLHEIDPKDWLTLFQNDLPKCLKDDGVLLMVEDCQIPVGEMAYTKGFLVLDTQQVKILFGITESDHEFICDIHPDNQRLKAHVVPKRYLSKITSDSRRKAIRSVSDTAKDQIRKLRAQEAKNYKNGLLHGFWTQQFANAMLNLDEFGEHER